MTTEHEHAMAERVRQACIEAALAAYEDASISGLCAEGALEVAISAVRGIDLDVLLGATQDTDERLGD